MLCRNRFSVFEILGFPLTTCFYFTLTALCNCVYVRTLVEFAPVSELQMQYPEASVAVNAPDTVVADTHERLKTALWEVVENAAKHGGDPPIIEVDVTDTETGVTIAVRDNGPGLPEIEQEVLESSMETPLVHGEGLGLWLIHWIVTSLDGELETTTRDEGTTVTIRLPKAS